MKKLLAALTTGSLLMLSACGTDDTADPEDKQQIEQKEDKEASGDVSQEVVEEVEENVSDDSDDMVQSWEDPDIGKITILGAGYNPEEDSIGIDEPLKTVEAGPMKLDIMNLLVFEVEPNEDAKTLFFNDMDKLRAVVMEMKVENTSDQDVTFDPNQSVIVTNAGEQVESDMFLMGEQGGDFLGAVKKEGQTWWLLNNLEEDISSIKMIIPSPFTTEAWDDLAEEQRLEFEVLPFEELERFDKEIAK